jgi:hypothetical protein
MSDMRIARGSLQSEETQKERRPQCEHGGPKSIGRKRPRRADTLILNATRYSNGQAVKSGMRSAHGFA